MSQVGSVRATIVVDVEPDVAFEIFTEETAAWYRSAIAGAPGDAGGQLRFDRAAATVFRVGRAGEAEIEAGRITIWVPGQRLESSIGWARWSTCGSSPPATTRE
jgi:hypothetical protein